MLERPIKYRFKDGYHYGYEWCGGKCRWATYLKTKTIRDFYKTLNDEVTDYVGIAFDEPSRFDWSKREGKLMPLVTWKMTEADCLAYCRERGYDWLEKSTMTESGVIDLYDILDRVSCWCCSNKNKKELKNIYKYLPQYWGKLRELQSKIQRPFKKYSKNGKPYGTIFELEESFKEEL